MHEPDHTASVPPSTSDGPEEPVSWGKALRPIAVIVAIGIVLVLASLAFRAVTQP